MSFHDYINVILLVVLLVLLFYEYQSRRQTTQQAAMESFDSRHTTAAPPPPPPPSAVQPHHAPKSYTLSPFGDGTASVYSSLPPQVANNNAWKYLAPFQKTCINGCSKKCERGKQFVCGLTPHNQRVCKWQ
jgi:hypothetical protein